MKHFSLTCLFFLVSFSFSYADNSDCVEKTTRYKFSENSYLYCHYNTCGMTAVIVQRQVANKPYYDVDEVLIPRFFNLPIASIGMQSENSDVLDFKVIEIGEEALKNCTAKSLDFSLPSNISAIRKGALSEMPNMTGSLVLPDGLTLIEEEGIYTGFTSVTFPASLENLSTSSVILENVTTITFEGSVPPVCGTDGGFTPWNKEGAATPRNAEIIIPDGTYELYLHTPGIGDYFTYFTGSDPTMLETTEMVGKQGIYSLTGVYMGEDDTQLPRGIYIINGKKVVK